MYLKSLKSDKLNQKYFLEEKKVNTLIESKQVKSTSAWLYPSTIHSQIDVRDDGSREDATKEVKPICHTIISLIPEN